MSKYREVYYCCLCGSELSIPDIEFAEDIVGFDIAKGRIIIKKMKPIRHTFYKMHECPDGSLGALAFIGFRKVIDQEACVEDGNENE